MIIWLLLVAPVVWFVHFRVKRRRMYQLASLLPKPKEELPLLGLLHLFAGNSEATMLTLKKLIYDSMQFNGIIRAWLGHFLYFVLTNPVDMEMVLKTYLEKDDLHRFLRTVVGNGVVFAPVDIWRRRRKVMTPVFSPKNLENVVDIISGQSEELAKALEPKANGEPFMMWPVLVSYTLDSVFETVSGMRMNTLNNENTDFLKAANRLFELVFERIFHPWLALDWLYQLFPQHQEHHKCMSIVTTTVGQVINKRRKEMSIENKRRNEAGDYNDVDSGRRPFLDLLIHSSGGENGYSNEELTEEILSLFGAGMDTSGIAIGNMMKVLAMYPDVQDKVYGELYQVFGDSDRPLVKEDLISLKYMERVIKETQRLFPPVPIIIRKATEDITLPSGRVLPAGSGVACCIYGAHRDPKYWGPNAEQFDPDRFLPERFNLANACSFMPFSIGPRSCLGYQYAMITVKAALVAVLRRYRLVGDEETGPVPTIKFKIELTMKAVDKYRVALAKRNGVFKKKV